MKESLSVILTCKPTMMKVASTFVRLGWSSHANLIWYSTHYSQLATQNFISLRNHGPPTVSN